MKPSLLVFVALLTAAPIAQAEEPLSADARIARLEKFVAEMQLEIDRLRRERTLVAPTAPVGEEPSAVTKPPSASEPAPPPPRQYQIGPMLWNGEFRLYFDSLIRPASPDTPRVANTRGRYLLHLDMRTPVHRTLDVRARLSTGAFNNPLTDVQDFGAGAAKHPISIAEAFVDFHPNPRLSFQGGRVDSPFNDRSRFLFDLDTRFNGLNESFSMLVAPKSRGLTRIRFLAGQYVFTNPNIAAVEAGVPGTAVAATPSQALLASGVEPGQPARASVLFQQGVIVDHRVSDNINQHVALDLELFRNPNQLALLSTRGGLFLVGTSIGWTPASPLPSLGNGTTLPIGGRFTASAFRILHGGYRLEHRAILLAGRNVPATLDLQYARNLGVEFENNALMLSASVGQATPRNGRLAYAFYRKEANALIGQLTENDIAVGSNVNMAAHFIRFEYGVVRNVTIASNLVRTSFLSNSDPSRSFFVPLGRDVPTQLRYQLMLITRF